MLKSNVEIGVDIDVTRIGLTHILYPIRPLDLAIQGIIRVVSPTISPLVVSVRRGSEGISSARRRRGL